MDLPDVTHSHSVDYKDPVVHCSEDGDMVTFVDDATHYFADNDADKVTEKISQKFEIIEKYMNENKLVINGDKSHLVVLRKRAQEMEASRVVLRAGNHVIKQSNSEKLLGATIDQSGGWRVMLRDGDASVLKQVTSRLNGLKKIAANADFKTKLAVANGIIQSKLQYLMPLWIGAPDYLVKAFQVQQLNAARTVCGYSSYYWSTSKLLDKCGWLSIRQQLVASTVAMAHNVMKTGTPRNIFETMSADHPYRTRQATRGEIRYAVNFSAHNSSLSEKTFKYQARKYYNQIPGEIREMKKGTFKSQVRKWVKQHIPIR